MKNILLTLCLLLISTPMLFAQSPATRDQEKAAHQAKVQADRDRAQHIADSIRQAVQAQMEALQAGQDADARSREAAGNQIQPLPSKPKSVSGNPYAPEAAPAGTVSFYVRNHCDQSFQYAIEDGSSTRTLSIGANEKALRHAKPGAQIWVMNGNQRRGMIGTVGKEPGKTIVICR